MSTVDCPYCEHQFEVNYDDGHGTEPSEQYEQECPECLKIFTFDVSWHPFHMSSIADCLNGGDHDLRPAIRVPSYKNPNQKICIACGEYFPPLE